MGIWSTLKQHAGAQFLEVVEWLDDTRDTLVYRFPVFNQAITDNSKLVVREGQAAVFVAGGKLSEGFGPGTYTLDTRNVPVMAFFQSIMYSLNYPYKGDIYFVSTRQFTDRRWGTPNPIMMRDAEFGPVRIRAFGIYSYRITDPGEFLRQVVGTDGLFTTDEIDGQFKKKLQSQFASSVGQARIPVLDLAANYMTLGEGIRDSMNPAFNSGYGVTITDFTIENISMPPEVEKALDTRTKMGVLGNLDAYTKLKAADAIEVAAANQGLAGAGMGMGVGFGMGNVVGNQMAAGAGAGQFNPQAGMQGAAAPAPPPLPSAVTYHYNGPSGTGQFTADDIAGRVAGARDGKHMVWSAGWAGWKSWKEVAEIAGKVPPPAAPSAPPVPDITFHYSGPGGDGQKSLADVLALLASDPDGAHHLWRKGYDGWKDAKDVAEVQAAMANVPPPPPPMDDGPPPLP
jgi:membrane protease subunit (stomatin/prohibitin family)